jgi:S1-C subfamily serine protease
VRVDRDGYDGRETSAILRAGSNDAGELVLRPSDSRPGRFGIDVDLTAPHLLVKAIDPSGPAAKTQLRAGDVITSIGPRDVSRMTSRDARYYLRGHVGEEVKLVLARGVTITIVLGPAEAPRP